MKIALDAGHGRRNGRPTGAQANGVVEDDLALAVVHKLRWYLLQAGCGVVLTRPGRAYADLASRGRRAVAEGCGMFVSIHFNAASSPDARGAEVFVADGDLRSARLAGKLVEVMAGCGFRRRGVKWDSQSRHRRLKVLRDTYRQMPAVLLETGFLTNPEDAAVLRDAAALENLAARLAAVVAGWQTVE